VTARKDNCREGPSFFSRPVGTLPRLRLQVHSQRLVLHIRCRHLVAQSLPPLTALDAVWHCPKKEGRNDVVAKLGYVDRAPRNRARYWQLSAARYENTALIIRLLNKFDKGRLAFPHTRFVHGHSLLRMIAMM
jgi:hypothetical protein